jgi:hypothetical protein
MNRRMLGNLLAQRAQLGHRLQALRHAPLWKNPAGPQGPAPIRSTPELPSAQRAAVNTWEDEGGAMKPIVDPSGEEHRSTR